MRDEHLVDNAARVGQYLIDRLREIPQIKEVRGKGLMIGLEFDQPVKELRHKLLFEQHVFTGASGHERDTIAAASVAIARTSRLFYR